MNNIQVGDIVTCADNIKAAVIDTTTDDKYIVFNENGCVETVDEKDIKQTGEYTDLVDALMSKLQRTNDDEYYYIVVGVK